MDVPGGPAELSGRRVRLSAFRIARHPVTVAEYGVFLAAGGYRSRRYWTERGWAWRQSVAAERPRFWGDDAWATYLTPTHPVVGVSAHEAEAFAAFSDARLPTEAEWERACRGARGSAYPWGDEPREGASQHRSSGPRHTMPVGSYPLGQTPTGIFDLVGSVWQWCRDVADDSADPGEEDPFVDPDDYDESAPRVTRGGAWNTLPWSACCGGKNAYPPTAQFSNLGFRLVVPAG